jgi:dihydrodipicolinate synthase/N-acetylneuraminate lyase
VIRKTTLKENDRMQWQGVMPAMTTAFHANGEVDHAFMARHAQWLLANGCTAIIALGSLGEAATLEHEEKLAILRNLISTQKAPVVAAISALSTAAAVKLARDAEQAGCAGLMILPPYVYIGDWRETRAHMAAILEATPLSCMLYNNPVAYKTDFIPEQVKELAEAYGNLHAVKESSTDVRRASAIRAILGESMTICVGVDDAIVEGIAAGATGWVAGLVNAMPAESVELFELARAGRHAEAFALLRWFLPLLRMDTVPKFVQLIKWVQAEVGVGSAKVRGPRMEIEGVELAAAKAVLSAALANPPALSRKAVPF